MAARRLITALIVLLVLSTLAAAFLPTPPPPRSPTTATRKHERDRRERVPRGRLVRATVDGTDRSPRTIRLAVGDELRLRVTARDPDQVHVRGFDQLEPVDRFAPASFDLLATERGRSAVRLVEAERTVATILVEPGRASDERPGRRDSG